MSRSIFTRPAALALSLALLGGTLPAAGAVSDVSGHWARSTIEKWLDAGKITGYEDGSFRPDRSVTRAEFAAILASVIAEREIDVSEGHRFADVSEGQWYYAPVMKLLQRGVAAPGERYLPDDAITRQDVMAMASRAFYVTAFETDMLTQFTDAAQIAPYAQTAVAGFVENGYVSGYPDGTLRPQANITRAECLQLLDGLGLVHTADSLEGIMERVYAGADAQMPAVVNTRVTDESAQYHLGLDNLDGIEEALASEPMMSSVAHSVCLVRVKDGVDVDALREQIRTSVNPRKWICVGVEPEQVTAVSQDNLILLVLDPQASQAYADSFLALDLTPRLTADADGLLQTDGYYMEYPDALRETSVTGFAGKVESLTDRYLAEAADIYYAVVPSKAYFVNDRLKTPFDYQTMHRLLAENITRAQAIDLSPALTLADYCQTDPHWRQERLQGVLDTLGAAMDFSVDLSQFTPTPVEGFTGQHGYGKENFPTETLIYLTSADTDAAVVTNQQNPSFTQVYNTAALASASPYDLFLSGASPLLTIENPAADSDRALVIFRDSFAGALAPLLTGTYKTITLIDLRYMTSTILGDYVDFTGKDVLFLYNDLVVNHSEMLR